MLVFDLVVAQLWNEVVVGLLPVDGSNGYRQIDEGHDTVGVASVTALIGLLLVAAPVVFACRTVERRRVVPPFGRVL